MVFYIIIVIGIGSIFILCMKFFLGEKWVWLYVYILFILILVLYIWLIKEFYIVGLYLIFSIIIGYIIFISVNYVL